MASNSSDINDFLRQLASSGNVSKLLRILTYGSESTPEDSGIQALTRDELKLLSAATTHLEFIEKYGSGREDAEEDGRWYFAFPEEFEAWLAAGRPGLSDAEVRTLLE